MLIKLIAISFRNSAFFSTFLHLMMSLEKYTMEKTMVHDGKFGIKMKTLNTNNNVI